MSQRKFERSRQEVVRFVVSSSNGNPLDILQIAYRTWERSTLFWNIFIPSKSKENPKTLSRNTCLNWKIFDIERITCSRNILRKRKRKKKERNKDYKIFLARNERLHVFKDKMVLPRDRAHAARDDIISEWNAGQAQSPLYRIWTVKFSCECWSTINTRTKRNERASTTEWRQREHELRVVRRVSVTTEDARSWIRKADSCQLATLPFSTLSFYP